MGAQLKLVDMNHQGPADSSASAQEYSHRLARLTPAELNIARFVAEGYRNREIGVMLRMTEQTVKNYVSKIFEKVEVGSRVGLARLVFAADLRTGALGERPPQEPHAPLRVLLAEDSAVIRKIAVRLLEDEGHLVAVVTTGRDAVEQVARGAFDVVIMDVQMPTMDGLEATKAIRARERRTGTHIPIIALTAADRPSGQERCLAAGMDSFLCKPLEPGELARVLRALRRTPRGDGRTE